MRALRVGKAGASLALSAPLALASRRRRAHWRVQRDVLACLSRGAPNEVIARELGLSHNTVRIHISAILRTLELKNRTQAALLAARFFAQ